MLGPIERRQLSLRRCRGAARFMPLLCERLEERALLAPLMEYQFRLLPPDAPLTTPDLTQVTVGQAYDLAVTVRDVRTPADSFPGVFAAYLDIGYDSTKAKVQAAEIQRVSIGPFTGTNPHTAASGTFSFNVGGQSTGTINFASNLTTLATAIQDALAAVGSIGTGNVRVTPPPPPAGPSYSLDFEIRFVGALLDQDVPNLTVASQSISGGTSAAVSVTHPGDLQTAPGRALSFTEAFRSRTQPIYFPNGLYAENLSDLINDVGAFASLAPTGSESRELVRARFKATAAGTVTFTPDVTNVERPAHSTVMFNPPSALTTDQIVAAPKTLIVVAAAAAVANPDLATVAEDSAPTTINVLANDTPAGTMQIESVSQPAHGAVTFTATNVAYTPALNFVGSDTFTYTARPTGGGAPATGTVAVTVTAVNDPPRFTKGPNVTTTDDAFIVIVPGWATAISAGPANEASQATYFDVEIDNPELFDDEYVSVDSDGELVFLPNFNVSGIATITLVLRDDGGTAGGGNDASVPQTFTIEITRPYRWRNSGFPVNVDGSDEDFPVSAIDAVLVINHLNNTGGGEVPSEAPDGPPYLDVNGDNYVAPDDAIEVINYLNNESDFPSEAAPAAASLLAAPAQAAGESSAAARDAEREALFAALTADLLSPVARRRRLR